MQTVLHVGVLKRTVIINSYTHSQSCMTLSMDHIKRTVITNTYTHSHTQHNHPHIDFLARSHCNYMFAPRVLLMFLWNATSILAPTLLNAYFPAIV